MKINVKVLRDRLNYFNFGYEYLADVGLSKRAVDRIMDNGRCRTSAVRLISKALDIHFNGLTEV